jgi:hypothetical protein
MKNPHDTLLKKYLELPQKLEAAVAGLSNEDLDLRLEGWSIRQYVHHVVEGELLWQINLRAIIGTDGIEFPMRWYFALSQDEWADKWAADKRLVEPTLALFRGSTRSLVELLQHIQPEEWRHFGRVTFPGSDSERRYTVRDIVLMHIRHMDQHLQDIRDILASLAVNTKSIPTVVDSRG